MWFHDPEGGIRVTGEHAEQVLETGRVGKGVVLQDPDEIGSGLEGSGDRVVVACADTDIGGEPQQLRPTAEIGGNRVE